ncbi:enoyl-CoA hydratase [Roseobacter sp. YSTF-M11]|uniref:Enoyl-CoA hydratase n=1 Tax=Roseobacter insulae TaxID=2859783 RepID=A0A9X1FSH1_9RHOB|nr:enoyl-CoA hydratase [Roseobacter insulae]MBW4706667.1 enoyl-CoA hydratase [Roseobacter insulae]
MTQGDAPVLLERSDGIATITLNCPKTLNALSEEMLAALQSALDELATDKSTKAVVLRGAGTQFCAGHNLKEMTLRRRDADGGKAYFNALFATCSRMMMSIVRLPQPVIAQVQGIATAAGCQLVASCDLAVAADTATFATSGVNIGLFCSTPMVALSRNLTRKQAMEMLLLGEFQPAARAVEMGLINQAVPEDELSHAARAMAAKIVSKSPVAVKIGKNAFYEQSEMGLEAAYAYTGAAMAENMMARDTEAGIQAFISKKPMPEWSGD